MNNFSFSNPTDIRFGKDQIACLPEELAKYGKKVLLVYGMGSIKTIGLYDKVTELLADFEITELSGVEPNPKLSSVEKGVALCRENSIDVILAVGGGSVIDAAKHIALAACYDGPAWDIVKDSSLAKKALPIAVVLTTYATGSETNTYAIISNEDTNEKLEITTPLIYPKLSICDPSYTATLAKEHVTAEITDIMTNAIEQYFQKNDYAYITDSLCKAVIKTCIKYGRYAIDNPGDYEAASNLMWAGIISLNQLLTVGKAGVWSVHPIEHTISAYYGITHGTGMAILTPSWMECALNNKTAKRFAEFARDIWGIRIDNDFVAAWEGIKKTREYFIELGMPSSLSEAGVPDDNFAALAKEAVRINSNYEGAYVVLSEGDIEKILNKCK